MFSKEDVEKIAILARVGVSEEEIKRLSTDVQKILEYVGQIQEVNTDSRYEKYVGIPHNVLRTDTDPHVTGEYTEELLDRVPTREGNWVKVKKILGN